MNDEQPFETTPSNESEKITPQVIVSELPQKNDTNRISYYKYGT